MKERFIIVIRVENPKDNSGIEKTFNQGLMRLKDING